jgi:putative ABC transport system permease protein
MNINVEIFREIYHSIKENKVRAILSGFGISWGILILVVMLGTGRGFQDSVMDLFSIFAQKSVYIYGGAMSEKYKNMREGAAIRFDMEYLKKMRNRYPEIEAISPETSAMLSVRHETKSGVFRVIGVNADYMRIKILRVKDEGRLFNVSDIKHERNVAVIGENVATNLFKNQVAIGKHINIAGAFFRVIGILKNDDIFSASEINSVYIPYSSYLKTVNSDFRFNAFCLYLSADIDSKKFEANLRNYIAHHSSFSSDDKQALHITNFETQTTAFESLFKGLRQIIWIFGICFLISGIVGISNIMFVVVKERTNEIGIRMAVGALPKSIVQLVLLESVVITTLSGLTGLMAGKGILLLINWLLSMSEENILMKQTTFDWITALVALTVLVIAGMIAGAFPAVKASTIEPVDAIRYENRG